MATERIELALQAALATVAVPSCPPVRRLHELPGRLESRPRWRPETEILGARSRVRGFELYARNSRS